MDVFLSELPSFVNVCERFELVWRSGFPYVCVFLVQFLIFLVKDVVGITDLFRYRHGLPNKENNSDCRIVNANNNYNKQKCINSFKISLKIKPSL